ncbi:MAG: hypothetical protein AAGH15_25450, partial [Myxococcota bacterium]
RGAWAARLEARAEHLEGSRRVDALWRAATLIFAEAAEPMTGEAARKEAFAEAWRLYTAASEVARELPGDDGLSVLRELQVAAQLAGPSDAVDAATEMLLAHATSLDEVERGALLRARYVALRQSDEVPDATPRAPKALAEAAANPDARAWAPDALRVRAATSGDFGALAAAHRRLAEEAESAEAAAAHLAASARAELRDGRDDDAVATLREALTRVPGHAYTLAFLEERLRRRGEAEAVVTLVREAAEAQSGTQATVARLLLAGAAAEAAGDVPLAVRTYEDAADHDPSAVSPLWALQRLAERERDPALQLRAREALAAREASGEGAERRQALELGEHYALVSGQPELAEDPLLGAVGAPDVDLDAALALELLPDAPRRAPARLRGLARLAEATAGSSDAPRVHRELGATAAARGVDAALA